MGRRSWGAMGVAVWTAIGGSMAGCARPIEDVDRTQGNLIRKSDLEGEWYVLETIIDVPPTTGFTFIGETGRLERVRFEIQRDVLVAYRSYPLLPGADAPSTGRPRDTRDNPVAAWPILEHVDVRRQYDPQTGEQSNVIEENTADRMWWERDHIRVDWSRSQVTNFDFIAPTREVTSLAYFVEEEQGGPDAFYRETDDAGAVAYFDVTGKLFVEPDPDACWLTWYGLGAYDCASAEILVRTSFARVPAEPAYEPFHYDDRLMSRFGYFRSERFGFDEQRGVVDAARSYLINRHHIWKASVRDGEPIPFAEREVRTVPYYLGPDFPDDPALLEAARATMKQWDDAARRAVEAATGRALPAAQSVFVLCRNPVAEDDPEACGEPGTTRRAGDLRFSTLHWVDAYTVDGLLGYGPSAADPVTGEIISGRAYVYGAAVNNWAAEAVDVIRLFNEDLATAELIRGRHFADAIRARLLDDEARARPDPRLDRVPIDRPPRRPGRPARPEVRPRDLKPYDAVAVERRMEAAREAGRGPMLLNAEVKRALGAQAGAPWDALPPEVQERLDPTRALNPLALERVRDIRRRARARGADMRDLIEPAIEGIVRRYRGRSDYDALWRELRAELFAAVAEHEVGHTLGLRHNFAASYDSLNYDDRYWALRAENLIEVQTLGDVYRLSELTEAQREGGMRQFQYSSIMDYGYRWFNDLHGIGKYDRAAILFGYTAGTYQAEGELCERWPSTPVGDGEGRCLASLPGYVEVFAKGRAALGVEPGPERNFAAGELLTRVEDGHPYDDPGLPSINVLERVHYSRVARSFPSLEDLSSNGRKLMRYADYLAAREAGGDDRPVRVPYLFCSDEWIEGVLSCNPFDQGADPFEMVRSRIDDYRSYYWMVNFRRDRVEFDIWWPLIDYYYDVFLPLSDYFQDWYVAPWGHDDLFDRTYDLAINAALGLFAEALATPPYGTFCEGRDGRLLHLSDEVVTQGQPGVDESRCKPDGRRVEIAPGEGRRPFSAYDADAGYYFEDKPLEAGHYWATLAAVWALVDPEARVIGLEGDAGVFAISFYDWFADEIDGLTGSVLSGDYPAFAPRAVPPPDGSGPARLLYTPVSPLYAEGGPYDPETGARVRTAAWTGGPVGLCQACSASDDCAGYTGRLGGVYCQPYGGEDVCLVDCTLGEGACPAGTECVGDNCVPADGGPCAALAGRCDADHPLGACAPGTTCVDGECVEPPLLVESEPTFALASDLLWYGMLFTTASYSTRFNDHLHVFRVGDTELVHDPRYAERHEFTEPLRGITYAAVQPRCDGPAAGGGSAGLCGRCAEDADCAGFTGFLGGTFCQSLTAGDEALHCLRDCTEDPDACGPDETCDERGNCVPAAGTCEDREAACDPRHPLGRCPKGQTCIHGACAAPVEPSPRCRYLGPRDTPAVRLIKKGAALAEAHDRAFEAWYAYEGGDPEEDRELGAAYYRAEFELTRHLDLLETVVATYELFGRIY